ncbi:proline iminopeptidase-family hydrolase [Aurantiacibacter sp. MUD11]|uniref:proline iminopeptidase-family hydrolase n=1 Tax=Aurantiacibacter sp. MUD11 TaxID=3003265 RepID=UPI0022AA3CDC|nr:proline iminopeptidase-family hydrolase [Aurantiacibacter sp. MUD11]WAT18087.1 proline iminopeptidase-family hydrolase [Aurantiacibacter sp. MUD11]
MRLPATLAAALALSAVPASAQEVPAHAQDWSDPTSQHMVEVEGGRVWVRVNGIYTRDNPPVVFIHGGPGGTHLGFGGMLSLADERAVVLYDQLDSGMSERPEDPANWRVERFVAELEAIRQALGYERWHLVGHSWGAALALEYAAAYPQHTASAVLSGTFISTPHWITGTNLLIRELPDAVAADIIACESDTPPTPDVCGPATAAFYNAYNGRPDRPAPSPEALAYRQRYSGDGWNETVYNAMWGPSEFSARGSLVNYDATPLLARIDGSRTLFMVGQYDEARIDDVQDFVTLTPGAELAVVPGGSHAFFGERPAITEAILRSWLARMDAAQEETE